MRVYVYGKDDRLLCVCMYLVETGCYACVCIW